MALLTWSDELAVHHPQMDATHEEFVAHIATLVALRAAPLQRVLAAFDEMLAHTQAHFDQEDRWMDQLGFAPGNCHASQHSQVLAVLREVRQLIEANDSPEVLDQMLPELSRWFEGHAQAADAALAAQLRQAEQAQARGEPLPANKAGSESCGAQACAH